MARPSGGLRCLSNFGFYIRWIAKKNCLSAAESRFCDTHNFQTSHNEPKNKHCVETYSIDILVCLCYKPDMPMLGFEGEGRPSPDNARLWGEAVGPFFKEEIAARRLGVNKDQLSNLVSNHKVLSVRTSDNVGLFPVRQFDFDEAGSATVKPAVAHALDYYKNNSTHFEDIARLETEEGAPLVDEWTIASVLLRPDEKGKTLLDDLNANLEDRNHVAWTRLRTLDGMATAVRIVLFEGQPGQQKGYLD